MGLFGGKSNKNNKRERRKAPAHQASKKNKAAQAQLSAEDVQKVILESMNTFGNGMEFEHWDSSMTQSFLSLGFDELGAAEVLLETEDALRIEIGEEPRSPVQILQIACSKLGIQTNQAPTEQKGYEQDIIKKIGDATHLMRCGKCGKGLKRKAQERCGLHAFNCPSCGNEQYDLGPLPTPKSDMPMGGMLSNVEIPSGKADIVIKWFCSWCGCTVGNAKQCSRCKCDLSIVPPQYGAVFVRGDDDRARNLYVQAAMPMTVQVALMRLLRADPVVAKKSGATDEFADEMLPEEAPPTALTKE